MNERLLSLRWLLTRRPDPERVRAMLARHVTTVRRKGETVARLKTMRPTVCTCELDEHLRDILRDE